MSVRTDVINLNVNVNGNQAQNQLNDLKKKAADVKYEMDDLKKGTQEYIDKKKELAGLTSQMDDLKKQIGLTSLTQKELNQELIRLKALKGSVTPFTTEFKELQKQIEAVENRLYDVKNGVQGFASFFSKIKDEVKQFGVAAAAYLGFEFITNQFSSIINGAGKLSDSMADIRKSTSLTSEDVIGLNKDLQKFDTRTTSQSLRDLAVDAGKLGIDGKKNIEEFVQAGDQINVALGEDLGKDAVKDIGKLVDIFRTKEEFGLKESMLKVGSAINDIGANSSASEGYIVDFLKRMGGIGPAAKIPLPDLIALAGTMDSLGQTSETSTTAIGNTISKLVTDFDGFAKIANTTGEELKKTFNDKGGLAALQQVLEGVKKSGGNFDDLVAKLGDVGIEGAKSKGVFAVLANNLDVLDKQMGVSAKSYEKGTSLTNEFTIKNETFGATLDKLGKEFNSLITAPGVTNFLKGAAEGAMNFIKFMKELPQWLNENRTSLILLTGTVLLYTGSLVKSALASAAVAVMDARLAAIRLINNANLAAGNLLTNIAIGLQAAYIQICALATRQITLATAATRIWNIVLSAAGGIFGFITIAITATAAAISYLHKKYTELSDIQKLQQDIQRKAADSYADEEAKVRSLAMVIGNSAVSLDARKKALQELIAINPQYLSGLTLENIKNQEGINIINNYVKALREKATAQAATDAQAEKIKQDIKLQQVQYSLEKKIGTGKTDLSDLSEEEQGYVGSTRKSFNFTASVTDLATGDNAAKEALANIKAQRSKLVVEMDVTDDIISKNYQKTVSNLDSNNAKKVDQTGAKVATTIKSIKDQIKSLDDAFETIDIKDKQGLQNNRSNRKKLQSELDSLEGKEPKKTKSESNYDQLVKEAETFHKKLEELKYKGEEASKNQDQKELDNVKHKYDEVLQQYDALLKKLQGADKLLIGARKDITLAEEQELNALIEKQRKASFEREQKDLKENLNKGYDERKQQIELQFEDEKNLQAQRFVNDEIDKKTYEANILAIDDESKKAQLENAEQYAVATVTLEGKVVTAVEKADKDVTKFRQEELDKRTKALIASYEAQEAERKLYEDLSKKSSSAKISTAISFAVASGNLDGEQTARKAQLDQERKNKLAELEQEKQDQLKSIQETGVDRIAAENLILEQINSLKDSYDEEYNQSVDQVDNEIQGKKLQRAKELADASIQIATSLNQVLNNIENKKLAAEAARNNKAKAELKKQLDGKLLSQAQYNLQVAKLDDEEDKRKKEIARQQAKREKALNIFSALMNTALAISGFLSAKPVGPWNFVEAGIAGALGAVQVAAIASAPLPEMGTGGLLEEGPYHKDQDKGLHVVDPRTGDTKMLLEKDEAVITGKAMRSADQMTVTGTPTQIASKLNSSYGGVNWASGAVVEMRPKWARERPASINPNMPRIMEQGGLIRPMEGAADKQSRSDGNAAILAEMKGMREDMGNWRTTLKAIVSIQEYREEEAKFDNAKKVSGLNQ